MDCVVYGTLQLDTENQRRQFTAAYTYLIQAGNQLDEVARAVAVYVTDKSISEWQRRLQNGRNNESSRCCRVQACVLVCFS